MTKHITQAIITRDLRTLFNRRTYWFTLASWTLICGILYFAFLEDFIAIQPKLRAKNISYGVIDIVIIPYLKLTATLAIIIVISLCSRLFHYEHFSPYSKFFLTIQPSAKNIIFAKTIYIFTICIILIITVTLFPLSSFYFFDFSLTRVFITLAAYFVLLFTVGLLAMVFSQILKHSISVVLVSMAALLVSETAVKLFVDPAWILPIVSHFSPLAHINRISTGVVNASDIIFFLILWIVLFSIAARQFNNTYLSTS